MQDPGYRIQDTRCRVLAHDAGSRMQDARSRMQDTGCIILDARKGHKDGEGAELQGLGDISNIP